MKINYKLINYLLFVFSVITIILFYILDKNVFLVFNVLIFYAFIYFLYHTFQYESNRKEKRNNKMFSKIEKDIGLINNFLHQNQSRFQKLISEKLKQLEENEELLYNRYYDELNKISIEINQHKLKLEKIISTNLEQIHKTYLQLNSDVFGGFEKLAKNVQNQNTEYFSNLEKLNVLDDLKKQSQLDAEKLLVLVKKIESKLNRQYQISNEIREKSKLIQNININVLGGRFSKPPIIIGGCGRSGTTLLLSILSAHPEIYAIDKETNIFCPQIWSDNPDLKVNFNIHKIPQFIINPLITHKRWAEKTPSNIHFFERIIEQIGEVKMIQIVRDGRDVILSKHPLAPDKYWVSPERWVKDVGVGIGYNGHPFIKTIKYEDLILDTENTLLELCDFLALKYNSFLLDWSRYATIRKDEAWFDDVQPMYESSIGKWKQKKYKTRVEELMMLDNAHNLLKYYEYV